MTNLKDIQVLGSLDFIRLNIHQNKNSDYLMLQLFNQIKHLSMGQSEHRYTSQNGYNQSRKYLINTDEKKHEVIISKCANESYMPYLLKIDEPDNKIIQIINECVSQLSYCNFTAIEFTLDFICDNPLRLYQFMKETMLISWRGKPLDVTYQSTVYLNNIRTANGKGGKFYLKTLQDHEGNMREVVRVEITLKRNVLKRKQVHNFEDLRKLTIHDVFHYITFKEFNENLFFNKLLNLNYQREQIKSIIEEIRNLIKDGLLYDANVMAKSYLKNKSYLKPHPFNKHFITRSSGCTFLNGDVFYLDSNMMSS